MHSLSKKEGREWLPHLSSEWAVENGADSLKLVRGGVGMRISMNK